MAPTSLEVVFTLPDSQRLTFRTHYSSLLNLQEWHIMVGAIADEVYRKASINLFRFLQGLRDFSRLANGPSFVDPEAAQVTIELWIKAFCVAEDDNNDSNDDATDGNDSDSDSVEVKQRNELLHQADGLIRDLDAVVLNRAMGRSFQESQVLVRSFGGAPASRVALENLKSFTAEEGECGAAVAVCTVCLEEMLRGEQVCRMPCLHLFHRSCLGHWLEVSSLCPLCGFKLQY